MTTPSRSLRLRHPHLDDDQLLLLQAGELPAAEATAACTHLDSCAGCRARAGALQAMDTTLATGATLTGPPVTTPTDLVRTTGQRRTLQDAMRRAAWTPAAAFTSARRAWVAAALLVMTYGAYNAFSGHDTYTAWQNASSHRGSSHESEAFFAQTRMVDPRVRALPIRAITPGATVELPADELCRQLPRDPVPVPEEVRLDILRKYGMERLADHEYELDYLITPALGGAPDPRNLWPEPYQSPVWNARVKDQLEDLLPQLVCAGKVDLRTAQQDIAADWIAAYKKYFKTDRPLTRPAARG